MLVSPNEAWSKAADLAEAYQIGKWESQAAFRLLNDVPDSIVQRLMGQVQWPADLLNSEQVLSLLCDRLANDFLCTPVKFRKPLPDAVREALGCKADGIAEKISDLNAERGGAQIVAGTPNTSGPTTPRQGEESSRTLCRPVFEADDRPINASRVVKFESLSQQEFELKKEDGTAAPFRYNVKHRTMVTCFEPKQLQSSSEGGTLIRASMFGAAILPAPLQGSALPEPDSVKDVGFSKLPKSEHCQAVLSESPNDFQDQSSLLLTKVSWFLCAMPADVTELSDDDDTPVVRSATRAPSGAKSAASAAVASKSVDKAPAPKVEAGDKSKEKPDVRPKAKGKGAKAKASSKKPATATKSKPEKPVAEESHPEETPEEPVGPLKRPAAESAAASPSKGPGDVTDVGPDAAPESSEAEPPSKKSKLMKKPAAAKATMKRPAAAVPPKAYKYCYYADGKYGIKFHGREILTVEPQAKLSVKGAASKAVTSPFPRNEPVERPCPVVNLQQLQDALTKQKEKCPDAGSLAVAAECDEAEGAHSDRTLATCLDGEALLVEAIFAVLSVTPDGKLSENALAEGICKHYQDSNLVPVGIGLEAVQSLCGKMAFGLRKCVQKFKRTWKESPDASKLKGLTSLKQRLKELNIEITETSSAASSAEAVEEIGNALPEEAQSAKEPRPGVDWVGLAKKMKAFKAQAPGMLETHGAPLSEKAAGTADKKPVATPARSSKHVLPDFVVQTLQDAAKPAQPFALNDGNEDDPKLAACTADGEANGNPSEKKKKKKPVAKGKARGKTAKKKKPAVIAGPAEERALELLPEAAGQAADEVKYKPGEFNQKRLNFIREQKKQGIAFQKAQDLWMSSNERADLISNLPAGELKKRRFL
eukprot:s3758_g12.t1